MKIHPLVNAYRNWDLGIMLGDLHDRNVLMKDDVLFFIDTKFFISHNVDYIYNKGGNIGTKVFFEDGGVINENKLVPVYIKTDSSDDYILIEVSDYLPFNEVINVVSVKYPEYIYFKYKGVKFFYNKETNADSESVITTFYNTGLPVISQSYPNHYIAWKEGEKWASVGVGNTYEIH
jgi:hypothetical protein